MGVDAEVYAVWIGTPPKLEDLNLWRSAMSEVPHYEGVPLNVRYENGIVTVMWNTLERFFDPHYPRGNWHHIRTAINIMEELFPGLVRYHGDSIWGGVTVSPVPESVLADCDQYWLELQDGTYDD